MGRVHYPPPAGGATRGKHLAELAILAAAPVVAGYRHVAPVCHFLAGDAQPHARQRRAARLGNLRAAFLAMFEAWPRRQIAAGALDGVLDAGLDLLLYRAFMCPARGHGFPPSLRWIVLYWTQSLHRPAGIPRFPCQPAPYRRCPGEFRQVTEISPGASTGPRQRRPRPPRG